MNDDGNLKLVNIAGIRIGGDTLITPEMLAEDAVRWHRKALLTGIGSDNFNLTDEQILRQLCFELMPFVIVATEGMDIELRAELRRFPYRIYGELAYQSFSLRLVPALGKLKVVEQYTRIATDAHVWTTEMICVEIGNSSLYLEIYLCPADPDKLPTLRSPARYRKEVKLGSENAIN